MGFLDQAVIVALGLRGAKRQNPNYVAIESEMGPTLKRRIFRNYLLICGIAAHAGLALGLVAHAVFLTEYEIGEIVGKARSRFSNDHPAISRAATRLLTILTIPTQKTPKTETLPPFPGPAKWPMHGVIRSGLSEQLYDPKGTPLQSAATQPGFAPSARQILVNDTQSLLQAVRNAKAGDAITLQPGTYLVKGRRISLGADGLPHAPIYVRARQFGEVVLELDMLEGFFVDKSYWVFENLKIRGACADDSNCEHAFHVFGPAIGSVIRNNELVDFNAALKVNGDRGGGRERFPDYGLVQNNNLYNTRPRRTSNPSTPLNINSGNGWVVSANFIADFSKGRGNRVSYAAFMKGNSEGGIFERNLVVCHWRLPLDGDIRLGLSFGGGGTGDQFCRSGNCETEHTGGIIRNNVIARCPVDVGIYLNRAAQTQIHNNLLIANAGIDVRFETSSASIHNNIVDGRIRDRDGGIHYADNNLISAECNLLSRWFGSCSPNDWLYAPLAGDLRLRDGAQIVDKGNIEPRGTADFCGTVRKGTPDIGPIEYGLEPPCLPGHTAADISTR